MRAWGAGCPAGLLAVGWLILVALQASQASNATAAVQETGVPEPEPEPEEEAENEGEVAETETMAEAEEEGEAVALWTQEAPEEARGPSFCRKEFTWAIFCRVGVHISLEFTHFVHLKAL